MKTVTGTTVNTTKKRLSNSELSSMSKDELIREYNLLNEQMTEVSAKLSWYEEQYRLSKMRDYGKSSEADLGEQMTLFNLPLFNEAEVGREIINIEPNPEDIISEEPETDNSIHHKKNKKKDISKLPTVTTVYELPTEEQVCPQCGGLLHKMKETVRYEIEVIPAKVQVHKFVTYSYGCRNCEESDHPVIIKAKGDGISVLERSIAGASLLSDTITKKFVDALPFYRQEKNYRRMGIPITRNNMCNWSIDVANIYMYPIVKRLKEVMFAEHVIHCDETPLQVLAEPGKSAESKSYVWVTTTAEYQKDTPVAIYNYTERRNRADAEEVLKGYTGYIMCDGYTAYDALAKPHAAAGEPGMNVRPVACLVHVRRKFADALKLIKPENRKGTGAQEAINRLERIFHLDNLTNGMAPEERKKEREKDLKKELEAFFAWVKAEYDISLHKTHYGAALEYAMNEEEKVMRVFEDGRLELDNSLAERTVKPFVIGRKNWLFAETPKGANASCILYSIVQTAIINGLIPFEYIKYLLEVMPGKKFTDEFIETLLPWSETIPEHVKTPENRKE